MSELGDLEANMIRLLMVWFRLSAVHKNYPKITGKEKDDDLHLNILREGSDAF